MNDKTVESVHEELLNNVNNRYQKTEGFPVWDILKAMAFGLYNLWLKVFDIEAKQNVDNLTGDELERFVYQRKGLSRKEATFAVGAITVTGEGVISEGTIFSTVGGVEFEAIEDVTVNGEAIVNVVCTVAGAIGNLPAMSICEMPVTVQGIVSSCNLEPTVDGYDAETDASLRERYYEALREPVTSGNIYHYKKWAKEVSGVGDVKVFPLWQGDNTVQVVIIDDNSLVPEKELVDRVQAYIDPNKEGIGAGEAPVGAYCTVTAAEALNINVNVNLIITNTADLETVERDIKANITNYLASIAFVNDYVSIAKIGDLILQVDGVEDYDTLTANGIANRIAIPEKSVAVLGAVVINVL